MASADDVKEMIRKRLEERTSASKPVPKVEVEEEVPVEEVEPEPEEEDFSLFDEGEALPGFEEEDLDDLGLDTMNAFFEEGRQAYYNGIDQDQMPYAVEDFEDSQQHAELVVEAWNEGWYAAHAETWTALALLAAKDLIAATDEDGMTKAMTEMQEAIKVLEDGVVNFDDLAEEFRSE